MYRTINLQKINYLLYLSVLPLRFFPFIKLPTAIATYILPTMSFVFLYFGLFMLVNQIREIKIQKTLLFLLIMIFILNFHSIILAIIYHKQFGIVAGEDTFRAIQGDIIYWIIIFFMVFYNVQSSKLVKFSEVMKIINVYKWIFVVVGYLQIGVISGISICRVIYDLIGNIIYLLPSTTLIHYDRISLLGIEPSSSSVFLIFVLPMIYTEILLNKGKLKRKSILDFLLILPMVFYSGSTQTYGIFVCGLLIFAIYYLKNTRVAIIKMITILVFLIVFFGGLYVYQFGVEIAGIDIRYMLFEKATDLENASTLTRSATIINDFKIFLEYPITGVGNGNQGYFYAKNISGIKGADWVEIANIISGKKLADGGGNFFWAFISGYGLFGVFFLSFFISKYIRQYKKWKESDMNLTLYYTFAFIPLLFATFYTMSFRQNNLGCFLLSLPLMTFKREYTVNYINKLKQDTNVVRKMKSIK